MWRAQKKSHGAEKGTEGGGNAEALKRGGVFIGNCIRDFGREGGCGNIAWEEKCEARPYKRVRHVGENSR